jgi:hypothetical protein
LYLFLRHGIFRENRTKLHEYKVIRKPVEWGGGGRYEPNGTQNYIKKDFLTATAISDGHVAVMGDTRNTHRILLCKLLGKLPLGT